MRARQPQNYFGGPTRWGTVEARRHPTIGRMEVGAALSAARCACGLARAISTARGMVRADSASIAPTRRTAANCGWHVPIEEIGAAARCAAGSDTASAFVFVFYFFSSARPVRPLFKEPEAVDIPSPVPWCSRLGGYGVAFAARPKLLGDRLGPRVLMHSDTCTRSARVFR